MQAQPGSPHSVWLWSVDWKHCGCRCFRLLDWFFEGPVQAGIHIYVWRRGSPFWAISKSSHGAPYCIWIEKMCKTFTMGAQSHHRNMLDGRRFCREVCCNYTKGKSTFMQPSLAWALPCSALHYVGIGCVLDGAGIWKVKEKWKRVCTGGFCMLEISIPNVCNFGCRWRGPKGHGIWWYFMEILSLDMGTKA